MLKLKYTKLLLVALAAVVVLTALGLVYARTRRTQVGWRSAVITQRITEMGREVGTVTTYYSSTGNWRAVEVRGDQTREYGLIMGVGGVRYNATDDSLYRVPRVPATPNIGPPPSERDLTSAKTFIGTVDINGLTAYLQRQWHEKERGTIEADTYFIPGVPVPVKQVTYAENNQVVRSFDLVSLDFREPTREELMQRYEGKPIREALQR
jgi:hypothetical protein